MRKLQMVGYALTGLAGIVFTSYLIAGIHDFLQHNDTSPAISYGEATGCSSKEPDKGFDKACPVYLKKTLADPKPDVPPAFPSSGTKAWICFDNITWLRLIPHTLHIWFLNPEGQRIDYDPTMTVHYIVPPKEAGKLAPKCRAWAIPSGLPPGEITMAGLARPTDHVWQAQPIALPRVKFVVQ